MAICGKVSTYCQGGADSGEHEHVEIIDGVETRYTHTHTGESLTVTTSCVLEEGHTITLTMTDVNGNPVEICEPTPCDYRLPDGSLPSSMDPTNPATHEEPV